MGDRAGIMDAMSDASLHVFDRPGRAWLALAGLLALASVIAQAWPAAALDWQPKLAAAEPWRWWTAACVHGSRAHLMLNVGGAVLVGALGWAGRVPLHSALAWALAWPLTQLGWLLGPPLAHFFGLSGVLHAGVAVLAVHLVCGAKGVGRWIGAGLLLGLALKLALEQPFGPVLRESPALGIAVAPWSHFCGAVAGLGSALLVRVLEGPRRRRMRATASTARVRSP